MGIENFIEDLKAKSINPLLKDQAVKYTEAALTRYQDDIGRELTPDELQFAANKLTPDRINSGAYAKKAIADAIRSVPIAGKTIAGGLKSAAEIPIFESSSPTIFVSTFAGSTKDESTACSAIAIFFARA
jgi:hypothetical protein